MKKCLLLIMTIGLLMTPVESVSLSRTPGDGNNGDRIPHFSPKKPVIVSYEESSRIITIRLFLNMENVEVQIYRNSVLVVDEMNEEIENGTYLTYQLSNYGTGIYTIYIKTGEDTLYVFEAEIEE